MGFFWAFSAKDDPLKLSSFLSFCFAEGANYANVASVYLNNMDTSTEVSLPTKVLDSYKDWK